MLYGLVPAATAGFVLTAMTNWTGAAPLRGGALLGLILVWLAGRVVMWVAGWLPGLLVAVVDLAFIPALTIYVACRVLRHQNYRNLILVVVLALLAVGNLLMHVGFSTGATGLLRLGQLQGFDLITLMMVVIAGRIIPAFSANWLRNNGGQPEWVIRSVWTERLLIPLTWLDFPAALGIVALLAGMTNGIRLIQWNGWRVVREPLLWILHLAYLWIVLALLLRGVSVFNTAVSDSLWQHVLGLGGIATLMLGVMTRVVMGHTGRPLKLPRFGLAIYLLIIAATLLRLMAALHLVDYRLGVTLAALGWILAFGLFVLLYWPVLTQPRVDGRPG